VNAIIPLFCLCLSIAPQQPRDRWISEDKAKHFFASFVVTSISAGAARAAGLDPAASAWVGAGVGAGAGVWKELRDRRTPGATVSLKDAAWDLAGVGAAAALVRQAR
jgi:putative lipoprotein